VKPKTPKKIRREIFVLTPEEKRIVCFVLIAFVLGLATKQYRTTNPPPSLKTEMRTGAGARAAVPKRAETKRPTQTK